MRRAAAHTITRCARECERAGLLELLLELLPALCTACALGCHGSAPKSQTKPAAPTSTIAKGPRAGGELAHASAFELVTTSEGAVLIWAPPNACTRGLRVQRLAADGSAQAAASVDAACGGEHSDVLEVAAAASGGKLGVAFIAEDKVAARVLATQATDSAEAFGPVLPLGAAERGPAVRGRLELAGSESGQLRVAWQAPRAPCAAEAGTCAQLVTEPFPPALEAAARRTDVREIPQPCQRLLSGSIWTLGVWYDAFCALDSAGQSATQVYAIRPEIFYAEANPTLHDCEPLGLSPSRSGAVAWGRCADGLRAHVLAPEGHRAILTNAVRSVECSASRPVLRLRSAGGQSESFTLDAPRDRLEAWLPAELASDESRAVFTGRTLLVASVHAGQLSVTSHHCERERLVSEVSDTKPML